MTYRLLAVAETELADASFWYEGQVSGLGREFLDEFESVMDRVLVFPEAWKPVGERHRRCLFRRFPFAVLYSRSGSEIIVAGVIDLRRDPQVMEDRSGDS
jgi:hypothetical protein